MTSTWGTASWSISRDGKKWSNMDKYGFPTQPEWDRYKQQSKYYSTHVSGTAEVYSKEMFDRLAQQKVERMQKQKRMIESMRQIYDPVIRKQLDETARFILDPPQRPQLSLLGE